MKTLPFENERNAEQALIENNYQYIFNKLDDKQPGMKLVDDSVSAEIEDKIRRVNNMKSVSVTLKDIH